MNENVTNAHRTSAEALEDIIRKRRTAKLLSNPDGRGVEHDADWTEAHRETLAAMIESAGAAPFHRRAHEATHRRGATSSPVPWRFHVLERADCRRLADVLQRRAAARPDSEWSRAWQSKISAMLCACGTLVQATWLPDPEKSRESGESREVERDEEGEAAFTLGNVEHVAAASAAVQNLLLLATAHDWHSYWSSGGILRHPELFELIGIAPAERLLGSIFLTPPDVPYERLVEGGLREERGAASGWSRWVQVATDAE